MNTDILKQIDKAKKKTVLRAYGRWNETLKEYDVNYSSLLSKLIKVAGSKCKHYASDLFIDWDTIKNKDLKTRKPSKETKLFGFRECGVDHMAFVIARNDYSEYKSLWSLDIEKTVDEITMELVEIDLKKLGV